MSRKCYLKSPEKHTTNKRLESDLTRREQNSCERNIKTS